MSDGYKTESGLTLSELTEIFQKLKAGLPKSVEKFLQNDFKDEEEAMSILGGINFYIGSKILKSDRPFGPDALPIFADIYMTFLKNGTTE